LLKSDVYFNVNLLNELIATAKDDNENYLRMDDETFNLLMRKNYPLIRKRNTNMREAISSERRRVATLTFLATDRSFEDLKFSMRVAAQTWGIIIIIIIIIIPETCEAIIKGLKDYIQVSTSVFFIM
jgi:hypothetical protein